MALVVLATDGPLYLPDIFSETSQRRSALPGSKAQGATPSIHPLLSWTTSASLPSSKYRPPVPSSRGEVASNTEVAAPCSMVFGSGTRMRVIPASASAESFCCKLVRM